MVDFSKIILQPCDDPTGNGEPAAEIVYDNGDGTFLHSGHFAFYHANQRVRIYQGNAQDIAGTVFDLTTDAQSLPGGNSRIVCQSA